MNTSVPFNGMNTPTLRDEIEKANAKIISIQRSKDHHKQRATLSDLQRGLNEMRKELKLRETQEKRARWSHAITPTANA
jgi:hypothetical protein